MCLLCYSNAKDGRATIMGKTSDWRQSATQLPNVNYGGNSYMKLALLHQCSNACGLDPGTTSTSILFVLNPLTVLRDYVSFVWKRPPEANSCKGVNNAEDCGSPADVRRRSRSCYGGCDSRS